MKASGIRASQPPVDTNPPDILSEEGRSVCRQLGIHWNALVKVLEPTEPTGYRQGQPHRVGLARIASPWSAQGPAYDSAH